MISYNLKVLNSLFTALSEVVGANISIYDNNFEGGLVQNLKNKSFICTNLFKYINKECKKSDANGYKLVKNSNTPICYRCHLGFNEVIIPYKIDSRNKIYVVIGPLKDEESKQIVLENIRKFTLGSDINFDSINESLDSTTAINDDKYKAIVEIITTFIEYAQKIKLISIKDNFVENKLNVYLEENLSKQIYINDLEKKFYYSQKQLESIVKEYSGLTTKKYILKFKIDAAKNMLVSTTISLQAIAQAIGIQDYNYFIKVFKSFEKETPLQYRKKFSIKTH